MILEEAIIAVLQSQKGQNVFGFDYDTWTIAENLLRLSGEFDLAEYAHIKAIQAYRKEEWDADLL